jgi:hypothetical protein
MTLTLNIPVEIEKYLTQKAQEQSLSTEAYALQLLLERISTQEKSSKLIDLLQSWMDDDEAEQQETGAFLIRAIDEDRLSDRPLFPQDLKGVTW